ncbi:hypothetical protein N802_10870 [Knoellia sinensis KCTC 19936]|uniref:DUF2510 domain-containing protein n=1 Tax=Knoellia sinensis KCTC 19936 TaxID=1385520 RepID=A0A0A0J4H3_9MICO|nr:DUF2510 domain-containing protein [Knoellia sinensis]KGN32093.1 hypothetical protein N802_10870 [Knoellia sinensis KCTC 19936]
MTSGVQAGWYQQQDGSQRFWDGGAWTDQIAPGSQGYAAVQAVQPYAHTAVTGTVVAPKSPALALLGSFFIPGLGQFMNGNATAGVAFLLAWLVSFPLMLILIGFPIAFVAWVWSMADAYSGAQKWNARRGIVS